MCLKFKIYSILFCSNFLKDIFEIIRKLKLTKSEKLATRKNVPTRLSEFRRSFRLCGFGVWWASF